MKIRFMSRTIQLKEIAVIIVVVLLFFLVIQEDEVSEFIKTSTDYKPSGPETTQRNETATSTTCSSKPKYFSPRSSKKKDWQNYTFIQYEKKREGMGEQGKPAFLINPQDSNVKELYETNGFNAALSDYIYLNRSLSDVRHPVCRTKRYLESLPTVSVVVPFFNEHLSVLMRTAFSVVYRSQEQLLKEVILVDLASTLELFDEVEHFVRAHLPKVKVMRLLTTTMAEARRVGARRATGDVIIFLDSRVEANVNWLPPLLEPIALNYRTVVCPVIDQIDYDTFEYKERYQLNRGGFNWNFYDSPLPLLPKDLNNMPEPFETPVMEHNMLAISRDFFWEIGGYDRGLKNWGGEQFELSFKVWQCGGRVLIAPCSRIGNVNRKFVPLVGIDIEPGNFLAKNYRRIAEVWMDEYKKVLFENQPHWLTIDPGDLTEQKQLKQKLKCKPFKWFMTQIAFDITFYYPIVEPEPFAKGRISSVLNSKLCVEAQYSHEKSNIILAECSQRNEQKFVLTWHKDVMSQSHSLCWDVPNATKHGEIILFACHHGGGNQEWKYDEVFKIFTHMTQNCLDYDPNTLELFVNPCQEDSLTQMWNVETVNTERIAHWDDFTPITGPVEVWKD